MDESRHLHDPASILGLVAATLIHLKSAYPC